MQLDINQYLDDNQNGFRQHRSTRDNLIILRWCIDIILTNNVDKLLMLIDYKAAFPSVAHNFILLSLIDARVKNKHIWLIKLILKEARLRYKLSDDDYGHWIAVCRGILQGDVVNPILFCVTLCYIKRITRYLNTN